METENRHVAILLSALVLAGCSNGGGDASLSDDVVVITDESESGGACANDYYSELIGTYDGQIEYDDGELSCSWDVDIQISGEPRFDVCELAFNAMSEGGDDQCVDIGIGGLFSDALAGQPALWDSVDWPVDGFGSMNARLPDAIYPIEQAGYIVRLRFDGLGNLTYPNMAEPDAVYSGVLVKQFDLETLDNR